MQIRRVVAVLSAITLTAAALAAQASSSSAVQRGPQHGPQRTYLVLLERGADVDAAIADLQASGARVTRANRDVGLLTVTSTDVAFRSSGSAVAGVEGVAADRSIGKAPNDKPSVERLQQMKASKQASKQIRPRGKAAAAPVADPLDSYLWGMKMISADTAHARHRLGRPAVRVGVIDTGIDASHPDLAPRFDWKLSRNFVTDIPSIDGPCEVASCVDPVGVDDEGHGTHVSGTIAASLNGVGVTGVAPKVDLVEVRAGQDSGYFFLQPVVDALTYSGNKGIDVVNMSFYTDPWLYNCAGGAPQDTPEEAADQALIIEGMNRALDYAHSKNVTLVAALGNNFDDLAAPRNDFTSPDFPPNTAHERTVDNASCVSLPTEGPNVIGVSSLGPSQRKADYSNYTTDPASGEIEISAPGGWFRDGLGTPTYRTAGNEILSTYPLAVLQQSGDVDADGNPTNDFVMKDCSASPPPGVAACGYYTYLQGTSMAAPHVTGVAALIISAYGKKLGKAGFGMSPDAVLSRLENRSVDHACPPGGVQDYTDVGRPVEYTATCTGTDQFNGFYGAGIVNALKAITP